METLQWPLSPPNPNTTVSVFYRCHNRLLKILCVTLQCCGSDVQHSLAEGAPARSAWLCSFQRLWGACFLPFSSFQRCLHSLAPGSSSILKACKAASLCPPSTVTSPSDPAERALHFAGPLSLVGFYPHDARSSPHLSVPSQHHICEVTHTFIRSRD